MPHAKATDELTEAAKAVMARGFASGWAAYKIAQAVVDETGEEVAERTVARRAAEWRAEMARRKSARERMTDLVEAMKAGNMDASEMIQALAMDHLAENPDALTDSDPVEVQGLALSAEKVRLKRREMDLRERAIAVNEKKLALLEDREKRAVAALAGGEETMSPEDRIREIKGIYGLAS